MKCITQINICNYRAFYNEEGNYEKYLINLQEGENLLIYGENGSGKSSLFKALNDIFLASKDQELIIQDNIFTLTDIDVPDAEVKITVSERESADGNLIKLEDLVFNNSSPTAYGNHILADSSAYFLTYRDLLKTYFLHIDDIENNPDLFNLIVGRLLKNISDSSTGETLIETLTDIEDLVNTIEKAIKETAELPDDTDNTKTQGETKGLDTIEDEIISSINIQIEGFNLSVTSTIENALNEVNRYLKDFFKANIEVNIENKDQYLILQDESGKYYLTKSLNLDINFFNKGHGLESYQVFLNEARLSALALCIYLAAVKLDQTSEENLKLIFLDDIFIGLDTSNRIPLLEILNKEFKDFQLFITTYDRQWYEIAKIYLNNWKCIEMYVGSNSSSDYEFPVIIDKDLKYIEKARKLIDSYDYFSAGNTIRKALENHIENIVPKCYLINESDLEGKFSQFILFYDKNEYGHFIDNDLRRDLYLFKDIILNPTSHYDLKSPIYKAEVEKAFSILSKIYEIPVLKRIPILHVGDSLYYINSSERYKAQYVIIETLYSVSHDDTNYKLTNPEHRIVYWEKNGKPYVDDAGKRYDEAKISKIKSLKIKLSERPERIQHFLKLTKLPDWKIEFRVSSGESIEDLQKTKH